MKLNCNIDGQSFSLIVESDKPLNKILAELSPLFPELNNCRGGKCGNCLVFVNDNLVISCLIPAFKINGASIQTFDGFSKSRSYHDIRRAFEEIGTQPCQQCYASKVLIIENIIRKLEKKENETRGIKTVKIDADEKLVTQELGISKCFCCSPEEILSVVRCAIQNRRKRNVRKS